MLLDPQRPAITLDRPADGVRREPVDDDQAYDWFTAEHQVLLAVVDVAATHGFDAHTWQLAWVLADFLDRRGHWHDWLRVGAAGLDRASRLGDLTAWANAHRNVARACARVGRFEEAHDRLHDALRLFNELNDVQGQADTHHSLVWLLEQGKHAEALAHAEESLELYRSCGNRSRQARALNTVGWYQVMFGHYDQAVRRCHEARVLLREVDDFVGQAAAWDTLGVAQHHLGNYRDAVSFFQESLDWYQRVGDRFAEAEILVHRAEAEHAHGNADAARSSWRQALTILDELEHPKADEIRARLNELSSDGR
jgi:tetratricopeptide (TPR) repeat protein